MALARSVAASLVILVVCAPGTAGARPATGNLPSVAGPLPAAQVDPPTAAPPTGTIAFRRDTGIWLIERDGTGLRQITDNPLDADLQWSPTGTRLAFNRRVERPIVQADQGELCSVLVTGTQLVREVWAYDVDTDSIGQMVPSVAISPEDPVLGNELHPFRPISTVFDGFDLCPTPLQTTTWTDARHHGWLPDERGMYIEREYLTSPTVDESPYSRTATEIWLEEGARLPGRPLREGGPDVRAVREFVSNPDPDQRLIALGWQTSQVSVTSGWPVPITTPAQIVPTFPPGTPDTSSLSLVDWSYEGDEVMVYGPSNDYWRVPAAGGSAVPTRPPGVLAAAYLPSQDCYRTAIFAEVGPPVVPSPSLDDASWSPDGAVVVVSGGLGFAQPTTPPPVAGGTWCPIPPVPDFDEFAMRKLLMLDVATGLAVELFRGGPDEPFKDNDVQCLPGSCLTLLGARAAIDAGGSTDPEFVVSDDLIGIVQPTDPTRAEIVKRVDPGEYQLTMAEPGGFELVDVTCPGATDLVRAGSTVTLRVPSGADVRCVFNYTLPLAPPVVTGGVGVVVEGDGGAVELEIPVTLSHPSTEAVSVDWTTIPTPGLVAGEDYESASGTVTFAPGQTEQMVSVTVLDDAVDEPGVLFGAEWLFIGLSSPTNAVFGTGFFASAAHGFIVDNDPPPVVAGGIGSVVEGDGGTVELEIPVTLSAPSGASVTVDWATVPTPGLVAGEDYESASGTVTFAPGQTEQVVSVTVLGDTVAEPGVLFGAEWLFIGLSSPTNAVFGSGFFAAVAHGFIFDDD